MPFREDPDELGYWWEDPEDGVVIRRGRQHLAWLIAGLADDLHDLRPPLLTVRLAGCLNWLADRIAP